MVERGPHRVLAVIHSRDGEPGYVGRSLRRRGYEVEVVRPGAGEPLPESPADYDGVVVFGGPMSANDDHLDYIRAELDWIPSVLRAEVPLLGVCLGAQLLARVLGAEVKRHEYEIVESGYYPIEPATGGEDLFPEPLDVYHWHKEGFSLPSGARLLAVGEDFAHQAYQYGGHTVGIQFHPEMTRAMMERWHAAAAHKLVAAGAWPPDVQLRQHEAFKGEVRAWLEGFWDWWLPAQRPSAVKR